MVSLPPPPTGRAALLASLRPAAAAGAAPPSAGGRAALLNTLKIKAAAGALAAGAPSEGRAALLARLKTSQASSSLGMRRSEESAPTSSPRTTSPSGAGDGEEVPDVATPPDGAAGDVVSPPGGGKPPSPVTEDERVTKMTGGLEFLKLGEGASAPPVVRRGEAGAEVKLSANYIRLELAEDR